MMGVRFGASLAASEARSGPHPVDRGSQVAESAARVVVSAYRVTVDAYRMAISAYRIVVDAYRMMVSICHVVVDTYRDRVSACHVSMSAYRVAISAYRVAGSAYHHAVTGDCHAANAARTSRTPVFWVILPKSAKIAGFRKKAIAFHVWEYLSFDRACVHPTADAHAKRVHAMSNATAIPRDDAGKLALLRHLNANLPAYATILDITADDLALLKAGAEWFDYILKAQDAAQNYADSLFAFKRVLRDGPKNAAVNLPPALALPAAPTSKPFADSFGFLGALITRIKKHKNYTEAIGRALNIIAAQSPGTDPATLQPVLTVDFQGGHPVLHWKSNGADALELEADHGGGSFSLLTIKMSPGYQDNAPLPPAGTAAAWKYRAIYRIRDEQVGHWSQVLEVGVKGV